MSEIRFSQSEQKRAVASPRAPASRRDNAFFSVMAIASALTVFGGFARTYYLKAWSGTSGLPPLVHIHGVVFTAWIVLFLTQIALIAKGRTDLHRRLGTVGGVLAMAMVVLGYLTSIGGARRGFLGQFPLEPTGFDDALAFLILGLGDTVLFAVFVALGLYARARPDAHKRLMLLATINLLPAALTRFPLGAARMPFAFATITCLLAAGPIYDWCTRRRVHGAYVWGGLLILISGPLRPIIGNSAVWHDVARWLIR